MSTTEPTPQQVLDLPLDENDSGADTVRGYLVALLTELWQEEEGFSGKRPFGNSSWQYDLYQPMARAGMIEATFDEDGYLDQFSTASRLKADGLILAAIKALGGPTR
jgi:hypothetical protein